MTRWTDDLWRVVGFYSRLPVPAARHGLTLADAVGMLPVASLVVAAPAAAVLLALSAVGASEGLTAVLTVLALAVTTGALHEDGLADCADGFWGGATVERRLAIMRDSRIGTYGVLALLFAVLLKVMLLVELLDVGTGAALLAFLAAAVAGRTVGLYPWVGLPNARGEGLAVVAGRPHPAAFRTALALGIGVTAVLTVWLTPLGFVVAGLAAALAARGVAGVADDKIGGHTGDVIGAAVVVADLAYLATMTIFLA